MSNTSKITVRTHLEMKSRLQRLVEFSLYLAFQVIDSRNSMREDLYKNQRSDARLWVDVPMPVGQPAPSHTALLSLPWNITQSDSTPETMIHGNGIRATQIRARWNG